MSTFPGEDPWTTSGVFLVVEMVPGIILFGASCTGKSYLMAEMQTLDPALVTFEMDTVYYTKADFVAANLPGDLEWLSTTLQQPEINAAVEASSSRQQICMISLLKLVVGDKRFVTTCGELPRPGARFYDLLRTELGVDLSSVLVKPSITKHLYRICRRGRLRRIVRFYRVQRQNTAVEWDLTITSAADLMEWIKDTGAEN